MVSDTPVKLYMAPLQSYTTSFYRKAHAMTFGHMDKYFTPFFDDADTSLNNLNKHLELLPSFNKKLRIVPQLASNSPRFLIDFANEVRSLGYHEINLNMGCPFPMLVKRDKGGGLLAKPELVKQLLESFYSETENMQLSLKIRLGINDIEEGRTIVKLANDYPIEELIIHPRLVTQKYSGDVNWDEFETLCSLSDHRLIANGDINSHADACTIIDRFSSVKGLMLGRGLLMHPALPASILKHKHNNQLMDLHENYFHLITDHYTNWNQAFNYLLTFWHYPLSINQDLKRHLRKLKKHNKPDIYQDWLKQLRILVS
ncbi:tRNA-dihydrouridine synthase [Carboxylicivirga sp. RSCT41]|uniref:tRNA-dihydrouridine synthase n=1 Tax=Carboxylicivirga agarovorans TaxID=3417570 RepID=UPI003D352F1F